MTLGTSIKRLFAAAAVAPLCFAAEAALAQTTISTATTAPLNTATAGNITVESTGTIQPATTETNPAITVNSNATVSVAGTVLMRDQASSTAILFQGDAGGRTFTFNQTGGVIRADDLPANTDDDKDGDLDGPFVAEPSQRYGVRFTGPGTFTGNITQSAGLLAVEGNNGSAALFIETPLIGDVKLLGSVASLGKDSYAIRSTAPITGKVEIGGAVTGIGENARAVSIEGQITGGLLFSGAVAGGGYRYTTRPTDDKVVEKLDADDLLIGGPVVSVTASVTGGIRFQTQPLDLDTNNADEDGDGVPDTTQTTASITSFGSAPAIQIGGAGNMTLGNVGTSSKLAYGLVIEGTVSGFGIYDNISGQAVVIGGGGGTVDTGSGVRMLSNITASSVYSNATAVRLGSGALVPQLVNEGIISAGALGKDGVTPTLRSLQIDAGATVPNLVNFGTIRAGLNGVTGDLIAISDGSGTLSNITNYGAVSALITTGDIEKAPVGNQIAFDLRANTTGVSIVQQKDPDPNITTTPSITGDVLFGSGSATLDVQSGNVLGKVSFGSGANVLTIAEDASVAGQLFNTGGLTATIDGTLLMGNASTIPTTTLSTGSESVVSFTADQQGSGQVGNFQVAGGATLGSGSKVQLGFTSKLTVSSATPYDYQTVTLIHANGGLVNNGVVTTLDGGLPYIYEGFLTTTANDLNVTVRRRTAAEIGLTGSRAAAFEAFYTAFDLDSAVAGRVFAQRTATDFGNLYSQFLPDYSGGPFHSVAEAGRALGRVQAEEPADMASSGPRSWLQEIAFGVDHTSTSGQVVYDAAGFGIAGGIERPAGKIGGTFGYSAAFATSDVDNSNRAFGSSLTASTLMGSLYWRRNVSGLVFDASATGGFAWFSSTRKVVSASATGQQLLTREAKADWYGAMAQGRLGASYEAKFGKFYFRPEAMVDYIYLYEGSYAESGGGAAVNLTVQSRQSSEAAAQAGLTIGARFGRTFHWGPELSVAYRTHLTGSFGDTNAAFTSVPGQPFTLQALAADRQRLILRAAIRGSGTYANFALEGSAEMGDLYDEYMGRLVVRFLF